MGGKHQPRRCVNASSCHQGGQPLLAAYGPKNKCSSFTGSLVTISIGTAGAIDSSYSQSLPPTATDLTMSITRNGATTSYASSATTKTVTLVGTTTKATVGFATAADGSQTGYVRIYNAQLSLTAGLRADTTTSWLRLDATTYTAAPLTPPVTGLLGAGYNAAAGAALRGAASSTAPAATLSASLDIVLPASPAPAP